MEFRVGSKVREKRPAMEVVKVHGDRISCVWHDFAGIEQNHEFEAKDLEPVSSRGGKRIVRC